MEKRRFEIVGSKPSGISLNIDGNNLQPGSGGSHAKTSVMSHNNLDQCYVDTNFEQEPGQLEGDEIYLNFCNGRFNSPEQIIQKHCHGQEMFIGDRSDDVFSLK